MFTWYDMNTALPKCSLKKWGLTPWLTGAGSRRLEGTDIGHENAEGMAYVGVRVEPTVRLGREVECVECAKALFHFRSALLK